MRYLTTLSQQMLTAVKHVADKFCFQQDSILARHACNTLKLQGANSQLHFFYNGLQLNGLAVKPADYEI